MIRSLFHSTALALAALLSASAASAQYSERPADRLSRHLRELSADPTSLSALIGAGQAALDVGDGNAALGFFARADERSPRNGPVKAGLARAFLMVDNPREALKMFDAARHLGMADALLAGDRGLAHDLRGDTRRAQQDYAVALARGPNDEVTKRYALSLGISGDRDAALKLIDPLLYKRDQGAWRARAFVLAMTGDLPGASKIAHQVMPARMAQAMDPFLARLASLKPEQKAAAVHLGEMPSNVRFAASSPAFAHPLPPPPAPAQIVIARPVESREPRRRPGIGPALASPPPARTVKLRAAPAPSAQPPPMAGVPGPTSAPDSLSAGQRGDLDAIMREIRAAAGTGGPVAIPGRPPVRMAQPAPRSTLMAQAEPAGASAEKRPPTKAEAKKQAAVVAKKKPEPPTNPSRYWVQVAGGADKTRLPREWTNVAAKAANLKGKGPWTAKNRATNRLLAGPYDSAGEAQAAVATLRKAGVGAFQWRSEEGEAVEKLALR